MPADLWGGRVVKVGEARDRYRFLVERWVQKRGFLATTRSIGPERGDLAPSARALFSTTDARMIVLGHTHKSVIDQVDEERVYANAGARCAGGCGRITLREHAEQGSPFVFCGNEQGAAS
jgi:hypothetical protein